VKGIVDCVRGIEQTDRPFMVVWEEFENWVENSESELLALLDGIQQVDNTIYIATTNYIDTIPERIKDRPSRFADVMEIGLPNATARRIFLEAKIHKTDNVDIAMWVNETEGLSIDHLKDLIISVLVLGMSFEKALEKVSRITSYDDGLSDDSPKVSLKARLRRNRKSNPSTSILEAALNQAPGYNECAKSSG